MACATKTPESMSGDGPGVDAGGVWRIFDEDAPME